MRIIQTLLYIKALIWLVFSVYTWVEYSGSHVKSVWMVTLIILLFLNAILFAAFSFLIAQKKKWLFYLIILFLLANIFLTVTDQVGVFDVLVLVIDFMLLNLVFLKRKEFK